MKATTAVPPSRDCVEGHVPGNADDDHGEQDSTCYGEIPAPVRSRQTSENGADLQPDEDERQDVHDEYDRLPHRIRWYAYPRRRALRRHPGRGHRVANH